MYIYSSGKRSDSHSFRFTPKNSHTTISAASTLGALPNALQLNPQGIYYSNPLPFPFENASNFFFTQMAIDYDLSYVYIIKFDM